MIIVMQQYKLGDMEQKFANLIWAYAPISSGELVKLCENEFNWKRTTTYTMLKRLCDRKIFVNENGTVIVAMSKEEFQAGHGKAFIDKNFGGSLPRFLVAFHKKKRLSSKEIDELKKLIEEYEEERDD